MKWNKWVVSKREKKERKKKVKFFKKIKINKNKNSTFQT
jgi:hypothetical protein